MAQRAWEDAAAALEQGDLAAFAEHARAAAIAAAAAGNAQAAREIVAMRAEILERAPALREPVVELADALATLAHPTGEGGRALALVWAFARALVAELPARHPLRAAATDLLWDQASTDLVLAALAAGDAADLATLELFTGMPRAVVEPLVAELIASAALVDLGHGRVAAAPVLAAACRLTPSPFALAPSRSRFAREVFGAATFDADGVFIADAVTPAVALATLRAAQIPAIAVPRDQRDDGRTLAWLARDADWRGAPLLLELDAPPTPDQLAILSVLARAIVLPAAPATAATIGAALTPLRADVMTWSPQELPPERAAEALAHALAVPVEQLRVGRLHAADVDELVEVLAARGVRGESALWALKALCAERASADLAPYVYGAAPELPSGVLDRARELLAVDGGWSGRVSALVTPLTVAAPVALALAADRGVVAATLALGAADAEARLQRAMDAARRWGAVLCVGIDRAAPAVVTAFARRLAAGGVVAVIGVRPGTPLPPALAPLVSTLTI